MINSEQYLDNDQATPVAVAVRVKKTTDHQQKSVILSPKKSEITLVGPNLPQEKFRFDHVLGEHVTQEDLFATVVSPFLPLIFDGFDFFVITYGGRSSGKSFTLFGPDHGPLRSEADFGILPRFVHHIFKNFNATEMAVKVSSFDVSNDDISDLLSRGQRRKSLIGNQDVAIEPATEIECHDVQEVLQCYDSSANVSKAKNVQNSVISHHFFKVILEQRIGNLGIKSTVTFVDLAPSNSVRVEAGSSLGMHMHPSFQAGSHVNIGLLSLENIITALGNPENVSHNPTFWYGSLLAKLLRNAFRGRALTLIFACVSPKPEDAEETLRSLYFAKNANKIVNYPMPNTSPVVRQFSDEQEEIRYLNSSTTSSTSAANAQKPPILPDLLHPNFMHPYLIQQQMLQQYMLIQQMQHQDNQQLQCSEQQQQPISSPFIPITSPMDLKSPLNVKMYLNENTLPMNLHQQQPPPISTQEPSQQQPPLLQESVENEAKPQPRERRRSSLAAKQKTMDSIFEESEHDSSTKRSTNESDSCHDSESESSEFTEENEEEDFDSDCSEVSVEQLDTEEILYQFAMDTDELIKKEQESILNEFLQNNPSDQDLPQLTQNLERLNSEIADIDSLIRVKDKILEEATQSSLELKQAKNQLESKLSEHKVELKQYRQQLIKAQRKLDLASSGKHRRSSANREQESKVEDLKSKLNKSRQSIDRIESSIEHISEDQRQFAQERSSLLTPTHEDLVRERQAKDEEIRQIRKQMELYQKQDQLKIMQLQDQLLKLSFKESKEDFPAYEEQLAEEGVEEVNGDHHRSRIDSLRQEKEKFAPEKRLLEHLREKRERKEQGYPPPYCPYNNPQTCQLCHTLRDADVFGDKEERRIVEIDTINEFFDDLIEHRNAQMIGHTVSLPHVNDASEQEKYMSYVSNMTENEAKYLLSSSTHRLIDIRCQGLASDQKVKELDHKDYENHKWIKRQQHDLNVLKSAYDMRFMQEERKYRKKIAELTLKTEEQIDEKDKEIQRLLEQNTKSQADKTKYKHWYNLNFRKIEKMEEKDDEIQRILDENKKLKADLAKYKHARDDSMTTPVKSSGGGHRTKTQEKKIHVESSRSSKPLPKSSAKTAVVQPNNHSVTED